MSILLSPSDNLHISQWASSLQTHLPQHRIFIFPDISNIEHIHYALVWKHPLGDLKNYPNLAKTFLHLNKIKPSPHFITSTIWLLISINEQSTTIH